MNASLKPEDRIRRSHLYRVCRDAGAHWIDMNGFAMPAHYGDAAVEAKAAAHLAIADLTALPRSGFKGWGMADWASGQGVVLPEPNLATRQQDGTLACRLSSGELLLLADGAGWRPDRPPRPGLVHRGCSLLSGCPAPMPVRTLP